MRQHFRSILRGDNGNTAWKFILIPFDVQRAFGVSGRVPVRGKLNGHAFRGTLAEINGVHLLGVDDSLQKQARVEDYNGEIDVVLDVDPAQKDFHIPVQLRRALQADPAARRRFDELPDAHRRAFAKWVGEAKHRETKLQRAARAVELIKAGRAVS
jgi:hypothetical protein